MLFSTREFFVRPGQPVKLVLLNADATDHNLVITRPGALEEVGLAANAMAKDPRNAASDFVPLEKGELILAATPMVGPSRAAQVAVLRLEAPQEPGLYPYVCTFPGHWIVMNGMMVVAASDAEATAMLEAGRPAIVREWSMADFSAEDLSSLTANTRNLELGMAAFVKARCSQCHVVGGAGVNLGPDLADSRKTLKGAELLQQILEPSLKIHEKFQAWQFVTDDGRVVTGVVVKETNDELQIAADLLRPGNLTSLKKSTIEEQVRLTVSAMPPGLLNGLTKTEILQLLVWLEHGELVLPESLRKQHGLGK
jgi:putative heme-binding domain-containing protein